MGGSAKCPMQTSHKISIHYDRGSDVSPHIRTQSIELDQESANRSIPMRLYHTHHRRDTLFPHPHGFSCDNSHASHTAPMINFTLPCLSEQSCKLPWLGSKDKVLTFHLFTLGRRKPPSRVWSFLHAGWIAKDLGGGESQSRACKGCCDQDSILYCRTRYLCCCWNMYIHNSFLGLTNPTCRVHWCAQ